MLILFADEAYKRAWASDQFVRHPGAPQPEDRVTLERLLDYPEYPEVQVIALNKLSHFNDERIHERIIAYLHNPDPAMRYAALVQVRDFRLQGAVDTLFALYAADATFANYRILMEAIGAMNDPRVVPFLVDVIEREGRWEAHQALNHSDEAQLLLARLDHASAEGRLHLIRALRGYETDEMVATTLLNIVQTSPVAEERLNAMFGIEFRQFPSLLPALIDILFTDPDPEVKYAAIRDLRRSGEEGAEGALRSFLAKAEGDDMLCAHTVDALILRDVFDDRELLETYLERLNDENAIVYLIDRFNLLGDQELPTRLRLFEKAKTPGLRSALIAVDFADLADERMLALSLHALQHDSEPQVRYQAASSFYDWERRGHSDTTITALLAALNDTATFRDEEEYDHRVCDAAVWALTYVDRPDVQAAVAAFREHRSAESSPGETE